MKITIAGMPGAGKGKLRKNLEKKYNIKSLSIGDLRREYAQEKEGLSIQEFNDLAEKNPKYDLEFDEYQKEWGKKNKKFVIEGRLAYHFFPESIRIFLDVDKKIGAQRILEANRDSEKKCNSLEEQVKVNEERCASDVIRYWNAHQVKNCYDQDQFDVVIDTTKRNEEEVLDIVEKKIIDYNQKMNPPKFYFGHPTRAKDNVELQGTFKRIAKNSNISFFNPFKDNPAEKLNSLGEDEYKKMSSKDQEAIAEGDLQTVLRDDIIGGIFVYNGDFTVATQMESLASFFAGKLNYIVTLPGEKEFLYHHPFFRRIKTEIFPNLNELEKYLTENRNDLFIKLRKEREGWAKDNISQLLFKNMKANEMYLGK